MTLTKVSTGGVKDDAVTAGKIPANAVGSSELADNAVDTAAIADDAVTSGKIADGAIVNAGVDASAAIAGTKVAPAFGSQNISTTGNLTVDTNTLHVDASDNRVGIGTASPASILHVESSSPSIRFVDSDASGGYGMVGVNNTSASLVMRSDDQNALANSYMGFEVDGATKMKIDSSGNVGIGTTSPSSKLEVNGTVSDSKGNLRSIPANEQNSAYTLVAADAGKHIPTNSAVTIPSGVFSVGDAITIYSYASSDIAITRSGVTLWNAADGTNADRTLSTRGLATLLCTATNTFVISGAGLS